MRHDLAVCELPGTPSNLWAKHPRETLVMGVRITIAALFSADGATMMAATGTSGVSKETPDVYSAATKEEMGLLLRVVRRLAYESLHQLALRLQPGCDDELHEHHWWYLNLPWCNRHTAQTGLQAMTREPARRRGEEAGGVTVGPPKQLTAAEKRRALLLGEGQADGRAVLAPEYLEPGFEGYEHRGFQPGVDGDDADSMHSTSAEETLVRVPVIAEHFNRPVDAIWDVQRFGSLEGETGACFVHGGMRSIEGSNEDGMLTNVVDRYKLGTGGADEKVKAEFNNKLKKDIKGWYKSVLNKDAKGVFQPVSFNGTDVRLLCEGDNMTTYLNCVRHIHEKLGLDPTTNKLTEWEDIMQSWAKAMRAGYKLNPTAADRRAFAIHARQYVLKKAVLGAPLRWYDWQLFSVFSKFFDTFGSLRLISQETMEGQMPHMNRALQRSNGGANAGRKPAASTLAELRMTMPEYMKQRAAKKRTMSRWLFERTELSWFAQVHEVFERLEALKAAGTYIAYALYCTRQRSFDDVTPLAIKLLARSRARAHDANGTLEKLRDAVLEYYAPTAAEEAPGHALLDDAGKKRVILVARKARWKGRGGKEGRALLHADVPLAVEGEEGWSWGMLVSCQGKVSAGRAGLVSPTPGRAWLLSMFGKQGRFPMGCGRHRLPPDYGA